MKVQNKNKDAVCHVSLKTQRNVSEKHHIVPVGQKPCVSEYENKIWTATASFFCVQVNVHTW